MKPSTRRRKFGDCAAVNALALPLLISVLACSEHAPDTPDVEHNASVAWTVTLAGKGNHRVEGLAADGDGNIFATGTFSGQLEIESGTLEADGDDAFLGKWDSQGRLSWLETFGGEDLDQAHGVAADADGNVYLTGSFSRSIDFGTGLLETKSHQAVFLAKLSADGEPLWASAWGTDAFQSACCVEVGPRGDVVVAGEFVTTLNVGGDDLVSAGSSDVFVAAFDADGAHLESKSFGDLATQRVTGLALDSVGGISLLGPFQGVLDFGGEQLTGGSGTSEVLYVAKLDAKLAHSWSRNALPPTVHAEHAHGPSEHAHSLVVDANSNLVVHSAYGHGQIPGGSDFSAPTSQHGVLVQFSRQGDRTLSLGLGSMGTQDEGAVALDSLGHRWVATSFLEGIDVEGTGELGSAGGRDIALVELDPQSTVVRLLRYGERSRSEIAWDMLVSDEAVTVGGWSRGLDEFGRDRGIIVRFSKQAEVDARQ
jgi:hypothetical protein